MSHLIAIEFDSQEEAEAVRRLLGHDDRRHPVDMADMAIVHRDKKSRIKMDRKTGHQWAGALLGGLLGALLGLTLPLPAHLNSTLAPIFTGVFGAGLGALGARLFDEEDNLDIIDELGAGVDQGRAVLLLLVEDGAIDTVLSDLSGHEGNLVKTSVSPKTEARLHAVLHRRNHAA
jgi:uncharacterized membrane protein